VASDWYRIQPEQVGDNQNLRARIIDQGSDNRFDPFLEYDFDEAGTYKVVVSSKLVFYFPNPFGEPFIDQAFDLGGVFTVLK